MAISPTRRRVAADDTSMDGGIAICVDQSELSRKVIPYALAIVGAWDVPATLLHVLEVARANNGRPDPIEWELLRREARHSLERTAASAGSLGDRIETELVEGQAAEQICRWARCHSADLIVLGTSGEGGPNGSRLGRTVRDVIEQAPGSVLLVPSFACNANTVRYRRILVPLDGSPQAESVLPLAIRLAKVQDAEVLLAHVVPVPELTEIGPLKAEDVELRERLIGRNKSVAEQYLNRVKSRVAQKGVAARVLVLRDGDARGRLAQLIADENVDLIVLSAQGRSSRSDVLYGSVTAHLINHLAAPTLIVRHQSLHSAQRIAVAMKHAESRLPGRANL